MSGNLWNAMRSWKISAFACAHRTRHADPRRFGRTVVSAILLLLTLAPFQLQAADPEIASNRVQFLDGSLLHGDLLAVDLSAGVRWLHPYAKGPIDFSQTNLAWIKFADPQKISDGPKPNCLFHFHNGDRFFGNLHSFSDDKLHLESWFGAGLTAARQSVRSITFLSDSFRLAYEGPTGLDGWHQGRDRMNWLYDDGTFIVQNAGILGRDFGLTKSASVQLDLSWQSDFNLTLMLFSSVLERMDYNHASYRVFIRPGVVTVHRVKPGAGLINLGQAEIPNMINKNQISLEIRANRQDGTIAILADSKLLHQWKDNEPFTGTGSGLVFYVQPTAGPVRISNIRVFEWDGRFEPKEPHQLSTDQDVIALANRDRLEGKIVQITTNAVAIALPQAQLEIPLSRVTQIVLAPPEEEAAPDHPWDIRTFFSGGGTLAFQLQAWTNNQVAGTSPNFGPIEIKAATIRELHFNLRQNQQQAESKPVDSTDPFVTPDDEIE